MLWTTLRGMLLNAYAFGTMGKIMGYAAVAAFVGAAVLLALGLLGLRHSKSAEGEIRAHLTIPHQRVAPGDPGATRLFATVR